MECLNALCRTKHARAWLCIYNRKAQLHSMSLNVPRETCIHVNLNMCKSISDHCGMNQSCPNALHVLSRLAPQLWQFQVLCSQ